MTDSPWRLSNRADPRANALAKRHYSCQSPDSDQFVPPGRCFVLLAEDAKAVWTTSHPYPEFVKHEWAGAWINSIFRREGGGLLASDLIRLAVAHTRAVWPDVPDLGMVTFIDPRKTEQVKVRGEPCVGFAYRKAGFRHVGFTKSEGLWAFQLLPEDMPEPLAADPPGLLLF